MATIFGGDGPDTIEDTDARDVIYGVGGDDTIYASSGGDRVFGGTGNDVLVASHGGNQLDGGVGFDWADYSSSPGFRIDLQTGILRFSQTWGNDTLTGIEAVLGSTGRDTFIGDGAANLFEGRNGGDRLLGNLGADTLLGGAGADSLDGGADNDEMNGGLGHDTISGGAGDDFITVGPNEQFNEFGEAVFVDQGSDVINGGSGTDTLYAPVAFYLPPNPKQPFDTFTIARVNLAAGTFRLGDGERSTIASIENVTTGPGDDTVVGSSAANFIAVGNGSNVVYAGSGADTVVGGSDTYGSDSKGELLHGGGGNDVIVGGGASERESASYITAGFDTLIGGDGNDTLYGGPAYQTMSGGLGSDLFVFTDQHSIDGDGIGYVEFYARSTVTDFNSSTDVIELDFSSPVLFAGQVGGNEQLDDLTVGYFRSGSQTTVRANLHGEYLDIILAGFTGTLTADDLGLG